VTGARIVPFFCLGLALADFKDVRVLHLNDCVALSLEPQGKVVKTTASTRVSP
jgi:hypothetical protein